MLELRYDFRTPHGGNLLTALDLARKMGAQTDWSWWRESNLRKAPATGAILETLHQRGFCDPHGDQEAPATTTQALLMAP